jgi:hypothetical protein
MVDGDVPAARRVLISDRGESLATSEQIVAMAQVIWPAAKTIEVTPYKAGRSSWSSSEIAEGFKLTISAEGGSLVAQIIAGTLDALKGKLDQRSRKKRWGSF